MEGQVPDDSKVFSLLSVGMPLFPRYLVMDQHGQFWNGADWSDKETEGLLYDNVNAAGKAIQQLLMNQCQYRTNRRYVAPVEFHLYSDEDVPQALIVDWFLKVSRLIVDGQSHGNGPTEGTVGLLSIDWSRLRSQEDG